MTEEEYIKITNHQKVRQARELIINTLSGEDYGFDNNDRRAILRLLNKSEEILYSSYKINQPPK